MKIAVALMAVVLAIGCIPIIRHQVDVVVSIATPVVASESTPTVMPAQASRKSVRRAPSTPTATPTPEPPVPTVAGEGIEQRAESIERKLEQLEEAID